MLVKTFGSNAKNLNAQEYEIKIHSCTGDIVPLKAIAVPKICDKIAGQIVKKAVKRHPFTQNLRLADDGSNPDVNIELLSGTGVCWKLISGEIKRDDRSGLVAINSSIGWLLSGPMRNRDVNVNAISSDFTVMKIEARVSEDKLLADEIHRFWDLDTVGIKEIENSVLENFMDNIRFEKGPCTVELPFKKRFLVLPDNYKLSWNRLQTLKRKINKKPELLKACDYVFKEQLKSDVIEEVGDSVETGNVMYLPHRAVIKNNKQSTKLRIVFDACAKLLGENSLNDVLYKGLCLTPLLDDMLLRFRAFPVAMVAAIEKAYLQINVAEKHRDFLRFLWFKDASAEVLEVCKLRFCRVIFGAAPSQFLLNGTIKKITEYYENVDPEFKKVNRIVRGYFLF